MITVTLALVQTNERDVYVVRDVAEPIITDLYP